MGVVYLAVDPPDPRFPLRLGESVTILPSYDAPSLSARPDLPAGAFTEEFFVPAWNAFIEAGEAYLKSTDQTAYPTVEDSCTYCQQPLTPAATELLRKYRDYCNNTFRADRDTAQATITALTDTLIALKPGGSVSVTATHCALAPGVTLNVTIGDADAFPLTLRATCALAATAGGP